MASLRQLVTHTAAILRASGECTAIFLRDVGRGMLEVSHNSFALLGVLVAAGLLFTAGRDDLRNGAETHVLNWLLARQEARLEPAPAPDTAETAEPAQPVEPDAVMRATAIDPKDLNRQQAALAQWLSRRYRVAPEPIGRLVHEAWLTGQRVGLDPTLILAIMAVESSFNPFAQSAVGAQGLMQVMTKIHNDKYLPFGGNHAAFDPVTNLRVGVQVLKECIQRAGSLEEGLRHYVGAANLPDDGGYSAKVLLVQHYLRDVVRGKLISPHAAMVATAPPAPQANPASPSGSAPYVSTSSAKPEVRVASLN